MSETKSSRIPVPSSSPAVLRRSWSVRERRDDSHATPLRSDAAVPFRIDRTDASSGLPSRECKWTSSMRRERTFHMDGSPHTASALHCSNEMTPRKQTPTAALRVPNGSAHRTRSLSLNLSNAMATQLSIPPSASATASPRTPPTSPSEYKSEVRIRSRAATDWDAESLTSGISGVSVASTNCDHASVARNGTTFSGRSMKYVFHCNQHSGQTGDDYLTPTQRAQKQVRRLRSLLQQAQKDLTSRDNDIVKLTREVVELRLYKAALSSPEERSNSSDAITVKENQVDEVYVPDAAVVIGSEMTNSYTDSGHYDDYTNSSIHSKDSVLCDDLNSSPCKRGRHEMVDKCTAANMLLRDLECEHQELMSEYEKRIQNLVKAHENESHELRLKHNNKVDELLQRIADINQKYWALVPEFENAKDRIVELESQLEVALNKLDEQEKERKKMYFQLYGHGKLGLDTEQDNKTLDPCSYHAPSRISVPDLLQQLQITQAELENIRDVDFMSTASSSCSPSNSLQPLLSAKEAVTLWVLGARKAMYKQVMEAKNKKIDPEITLQFLKSAIYYFLTDRENNQGHLRAIQSILGFTPAEIANIERARTI